MESSLCEKPERHASRRLSDHLVLEGQKQKVHSLVDKVSVRSWGRRRPGRNREHDLIEAGLNEGADGLALWG